MVDSATSVRNEKYWCRITSLPITEIIKLYTCNCSLVATSGSELNMFPVCNYMTCDIYPTQSSW
jgi:hypothetical protein